MPSEHLTEAAAENQRFEQVCLRHALFLAPTPLESLQIGTISRKWLSRSCCNLCVIAPIFYAKVSVHSRLGQRVEIRKISYSLARDP
jgi:hypothetical protein